MQLFSPVGPSDWNGKADLITRWRWMPVSLIAGPIGSQRAGNDDLRRHGPGRVLIGQLRDSTGERTITLADVQKLSSKASTTVWDLCDSIVAGNHAAAVRIVQQLHCCGELKSIRLRQPSATASAVLPPSSAPHRIGSGPPKPGG